MNTQAPTLRPAAMTLAWQLVKKTGLSLGAAIRKAWQAVKAKSRLAASDEKGVWIQFRKQDGTVRHALATRNMDVIPADCRPKSDLSARPDITVKFFDLLKSEWRCFRADRLIVA